MAKGGFTVDNRSGGQGAPETSGRVHSRDRKKEPEHGQQTGHDQKLGDVQQVLVILKEPGACMSLGMLIFCKG